MDYSFDNEYPIAYNDKHQMVHITQITPENKLEYYYCVACGEIIVACAIGDDKKVRPYFRHLNKDKCTESIIHLCCKEWLFVNGKKVNMIINNIKHEFICKSVEIEKRINTPFGDYIPDITITTEADEQIFVEINYSNKKDEDYCEKWEYLKCPVIEVDAKKMYESKYWNVDLDLNAIFYNGEFTENFHEKNQRNLYYNLKTDYIKSFRSINYDKALCQKIYWFWEETIKYNHNEITREDLLEWFNTLEMREMAYCVAFIESRKCIDIKDELSNICVNNFKNYLYSYFSNHYLYNILKCEIIQWSKMRLSIFLTTSFDSSEKCYNGRPYTYNKNGFNKNKHNDKINHDKYCYERNKYLFSDVLEQIKPLEQNCVELLFHKGIWKSKNIFEFILNFENGDYELQILEYYNYIKEQMDLQKQYENTIESYSSDSKVKQFIESIGKIQFVENYEFWINNKNYIKTMVNYKCEDKIDKSIYNFLSKLPRDKIVIFENNDNVDLIMEKYEYKKDLITKIELYKKIKSILKSKFENLNYIENKYITVRKILNNIIDNSDIVCNNVVQRIKLEFLKNHKQIKEILNKLQFQCSQEYEESLLELYDIYHVRGNNKLMGNYYINIGQSLNKNEINIIEFESFLQNYINNIIPKKIYNIVQELNEEQYLKNREITYHIKFSKHKSDILIKQSYKNHTTNASIIFQTNINENDWFDINNWSSDNLIRIPASKYTDNQIRYGIINYFKKFLEGGK